jgi:type IV pilus assembly protein PilY1
MNTQATPPVKRLQEHEGLGSKPLGKALVTLLCITLAFPAGATTPLADQPLFSTTGVPGNVALALSVEYPTAIRAAHTATTYAPATEYLGYFDPNKCYTYNNGATDDDRYFVPAAAAAAGRTCTSQWSGNFLNWATMQTIDPFRWALTGGYRKHDTTTLTVLERAWQSGQADGLSPNKTLGTSALVSGATPFGFSSLNIRVANLGNKFRFTRSGSLTVTTAVPYVNGLNDGNTTYEAFVRVKVCDPTASTGGVETNCRQYGNNWKPEGLIQQYSNRMRFSAFGYLNESGNGRDGGVLRARQKFVGPTQPVPGQLDQANGLREWDPATGVFVVNPNPTDATDTNTLFGPSVPVANSGVMNYLNKFGQITPGNYKSNDPVGELYYAALRYFKNLGNVPEWSDMTSANAAGRTIRLDGFPVITNWGDPIQYSCQRNFVLGIGDIYTHADKNVPGNTITANEPTLPSAVASDNTADSVTWTNRVGVLQGMGASLGTQNPINASACCSNNSARMAGLAYQANTQDIRPDLPNQPDTIGQTVQTYWVDVLERAFERNNQFYLAAKYGGFAVPANYNSVSNTTPLDQALWATTTDIVGSGTTEQPRPDNYFTAGRPDQMVSGLTRAFASIAAQLRAYTTSFAVPLPQVAQTGNASFSSQYDSSNWTGELTGSELVFNATTGEPTATQRWLASDKLATQLANTGWNTNRRVATWNSTTNAGVAFRYNSISAAQQTALDTAYRTGADGGDYLNYLRGERTYETTSTVVANRFYRARSRLLGDIVGSKARPVGPPSLPLSNSANPGYAAFKTTYATRPTVVYVGANDGMLHAFNGSVATNDAAAGLEMFAYVPSALYQGPSATPNVNGLAALGSPSFSHHYYVNATPTVYDIDFNRTPGVAVTTPPAPPDWRSILIGGLGKGGKSYYAIDVTDPATMTTEAAVAGRVMWEFTDPDLGFTYGEPAVVKTRKYGWVVILVSGYNNADGQGYFFIVNPRTGALLEKISTGFGSTTASAGLAHVNTYVNDRSDATADTAYAGDLYGNVWRWDLTGTSGLYPAPTRIATLTDPIDGNVQPVTSRPRIEIQRSTSKRFVLFGTGRLLETSDLGDTQEQSFYAVADGLANRFDITGPFPIARANMTENADPLVGLTNAPATSRGWYINLGRSATNIGWRVISEPTIFSGIVAYASILPNGDACNPAGISRVYATNYGTGMTALRNETGGSIVYASLQGVVTDLKFLSVGGTPRLIAGTDTGSLSSLPGNFTEPTTLRRLNWRELRTVD